MSYKLRYETPKVDRKKVYNTKTLTKETRGNNALNMIKVTSKSIVILIAIALITAVAISIYKTKDYKLETKINDVVHALEQPIIDEAVSNTQNEEKPQESALTQAQQANSTVIDPKNCEPKQYWSKTPPHNCIDKPAPKPKATIQSKVSHPTNCEAYRSMLAQYSGWNVDTMLYAMKKESGCNPNAVGDNYPIGGVHAVSCGLLQIRTLSGRPSCSALKDPATNIAWAHKIYLGQGYRAWSVLR